MTHPLNTKIQTNTNATLMFIPTNNPSKPIWNKPQNMTNKLTSHYSSRTSVKKEFKFKSSNPNEEKKEANLNNYSKIEIEFIKLWSKGSKKLNLTNKTGKKVLPILGKKGDLCCYLCTNSFPQLLIHNSNKTQINQLIN